MIELRTFGALDLRGSDGRELRTALAQPKRLALLVYLAAATPGPFHRRDTLLSLFWPDIDATRGRAALSRAVHYLRSALGDGVLVSRGDEELGIAGDRCTCDATRFRLLLDGNSPLDALALYRGDFMEGFFLSDAPELERWIESERQQLRAGAIDAARTLAISAESKGDVAMAVHWARQALSLAPYDEGILRRVLTLLQRSGERGVALELYQRFARRLHDDLELDPSTDTRALAESLASPPNDSAPPVMAVPTIYPPPTPAPATQRSWHRRAAAVAAVSFVMLGAPLVWRSTFARQRSSTDTRQHFIAVLPLANVGADTANEYFTDGMTDELIGALSQVRGLRVAARTSSFAYKNRSAPVSEVARDLHVDAVLEGSARQEGSRLRVMLQLVRAPEGYGLWSKTYDRERRDVLTLQREISQDVADALEVHLVSPTKAVARTTDPETYDLYLWGRYYWNARRRESLRKAASYFERAIERDSMFAPAYSGLADAYSQLVIFNEPPHETMPKAKAAALRALALDETQSQAHAALGYIATLYEWDWRAAEQHFRRALELNPSNAIAHHWYSIYLAVTGQIPESIVQIDSARALDPAALLLRGAAGARYYFARNYPRALQLHQEVVNIARDTLPAYQWLVLTYLQLGRVNDAVALVESRRRGVEPAREAAAAIAYAAAGREREAREILRVLDAQATRPRFASSSWIARAYLALGEKERALTALERAVGERDEMIIFARVDPSFDSLHNEPRYQAVLARMGLQGGGQSVLR